MVSIFISGMSFPQSPEIDLFPELIPVPHHYSYLEGGITLTTYTKIVSDLPVEYDYILLQLQQFLQLLMKEIIKIDRPEGVREFKLPRKLQDFSIDAERRTHFEREGYYLWVDQDGVCMQAQSVRGLFYATRTFLQIVLETGGMFWVRRCEVVDYPSLEIRGASDENARGQAGSIESLKRYVETLAAFKMNMLQLNLEDMFQSKKYPKSSEDERGCFSHEEIQELVAHAKKYFVDICPIQSTCGHMDNLFILPEYSALAEYPHASMCFDISNPKTLEYLKGLIEEEVAAWNGSAHFHIACDESYDVGKGRSKPYVEEKGGKGSAYLDYYSKVFQIVKECLEARYGSGNYRIYMYHDIMYKYQEVLEDLPKENLVVDYWRYTPKKKYRNLDRIIEAGFNFIVTPSAMDWTRFYPSETKAEMNVINIARYARQCVESRKKRGAFLGMVTASWGDHLNPNLRDLRFYNYILCGDVAWNLDVWMHFTNATREQTRLGQFRRAFAKHFLHVDPEKYLEVQNLLRSIEDKKRLKLPLGPTSGFANLFIHPYQWKPRVPTVKFPQVVADMDQVVTVCNEMKVTPGANNMYLEHIIGSARLIKLYAKKVLHSKNIMAKRFEKYPAKKIEGILPQVTHMRDEFQVVKDEYAHVWRFSCREAGLGVHMQSFDWMIRFYNELIADLQEGKQRSENPNLPSEYIYFYPKRETGRPSYFRKNIQVTEPPVKAYIQCLPFQYAEIFINGTRVGEVERRYTLSYMHNTHGIRIFDITKFLHVGDNCIGVKVISYTGGWPMINLYGEIYTEHGLHTVIYSDKSWFAITNHESPSDWETCGLDIKVWKHVDTFGKPPLAMGALYYPDFERGLVSHHTNYLGIAAEILPKRRVWWGWVFRLVARFVKRRQVYC